MDYEQSKALFEEAKELETKFLDLHRDIMTFAYEKCYDSDLEEASAALAVRLMAVTNSLFAKAWALREPKE